MNKTIYELVKLTDDVMNELSPEVREDYNQRYILVTYWAAKVGCWIPCNADNPPPADTPMLVWCPSYLSGGVRYSAYPVWVDATYYDVGEPGKAYTHYMLIGAPE